MFLLVKMVRYDDKGNKIIFLVAGYNKRAERFPVVSPLIHPERQDD